MTLHRNTFFLILIAALALPLFISRIIWLARSKKAEGIMAFRGAGNVGDQMPLDYSVIYFRLGRDTIWFNGLGNLDLADNHPIAIRYQPDNPQDARVDIWQGIWGDILVYGGIPLLQLICIALHPTVIPYRSRLLIGFRKPFFRVIQEV